MLLTPPPPTQPTHLHAAIFFDHAEVVGTVNAHSLLLPSTMSAHQASFPTLTLRHLHCALVGMDDETGLAGVPPFWAPLPPKLPRTVLTWIWPLVTMKEAPLIESVGLDAVMLIRHIRFGEAGGLGFD